MSVTFENTAVELDYEDPSTYVNLSNSNARELIDWLKLSMDTSEDLWGRMPAREVAARCKRRLWPEKRNCDPARATRDTKRPGKCRITEMGRPEGYLRMRTADLLQLATRNLDADIVWN
jgi:hypothetical protein